MARNEAVIRASPDRVFDVLADPRGYAYWVLGSIEIRDWDESWPDPGSRIHHTVGMGPLRIQDETKVEKVETGRYLQLKANAGLLGSARVKLELEPAPEGTRVTMIEDPADSLTAFAFTPLTHLLMRGRNVRSLERLAELAEGRVAMPEANPVAENPARSDLRTPAALGRGALAGLAGGAVMMLSTNLEMRVRDRPPSYAPAKALGRMLGVGTRGRRRQRRLLTGGHVALSASLGTALAVLDRAGVGPGASRAALFALAMAPEVVVVPATGTTAPPWKWSAADAAVSVVHHALFAAATSAVYEGLSTRARR